MSWCCVACLDSWLHTLAVALLQLHRCLACWLLSAGNQPGVMADDDVPPGFSARPNREDSASKAVDNLASGLAVSAQVCGSTHSGPSSTLQLCLQFYAIAMATEQCFHKCMASLCHCHAVITRAMRLLHQCCMQCFSACSTTSLHRSCRKQQQQADVLLHLQGAPSPLSHKYATHTHPLIPLLLGTRGYSLVACTPPPPPKQIYFAETTCDQLIDLLPSLSCAAVATLCFTR